MTTSQNKRGHEHKNGSTPSTEADTPDVASKEEKHSLCKIGKKSTKNKGSCIHKRALRTYEERRRRTFEEAEERKRSPVYKEVITLHGKRENRRRSRLKAIELEDLGIARLRIHQEKRRGSKSIAAMCKFNTWQVSRFIPSNQFQPENTLPRFHWNPERRRDQDHNLPNNDYLNLPVYPRSLPLLIETRKTYGKSRREIISFKVNTIVARSNRFLIQFQLAHEDRANAPLIRNYIEWKLARGAWRRYLRKRVKRVLHRNPTQIEEFCHLSSVGAVLATMCWPPNQLQPRLN